MNNSAKCGQTAFYSPTQCDQTAFHSIAFSGPLGGAFSDRLGAAQRRPVSNVYKHVAIQGAEIGLYRYLYLAEGSVEPRDVLRLGISV